MYNYDLDERCRQIVTLLAYPGVGPLSVAAIALNLGTVEPEIRSALETLLRQGQIVQMHDGRFASTSATEQERARVSDPAGDQGIGLTRRGRA
jgi:DNA-binding transcriptional regulator PaaX